MKKFISSAIMASSLAVSSALAVQVGEMAPDFTGVDSNGKKHTLSDYKGKIVVLEWTNNRCPYVRKHYESGNMQKQQKALTSKDVVWLSIISSAPGNQGYVKGDEANVLTVSRGASPSAVILDPSGEIGMKYKAQTTPHMYIVDKDGKLAYKGGIDSIASANPADIEGAKQYVLSAYDEMSKGQKITDAVTRPYGCSVKYAY